MNANTGTMTTHARRRNPFAWLALGTLVAGTFDLVFASTFWALKADVPVMRILQSIAAGLLGKANSHAGGAASATLGAVLHYAMILLMMATYYYASRRWPRLVERPLQYGALYGCGLWLVMNYIVVPLSAAGGNSPTFSLWTTLSIVVHILIGIACAWFARRAGR